MREDDEDNEKVEVQETEEEKAKSVSKIKKVETLLSKAKSSPKISTSALSTLCKLFKKITTEEEGIGYIGP